MNWFLLAIGAPFLGALVSIADQYLVKKHKKSEHSVGALALFSSLVGIIVALGIFIFAGNIFSIPNTDKLLLLLVGVITIVWIIFYLRAIEIEDISHVVVWFFTIPVFSFILGYLILGEVLTRNQIIGGVVIVLGGLVHSIDFTVIHTELRFKKKVALLMLFTCFIVGLSSILFKLVTTEYTFWISTFWQYLGLGVAGIVIFVFHKRYRASFLGMIRNDGRTILGVNIASEFITIGANFMNSFATLLVPITLVYIVNYSFQPVIVLLLTYYCTLYAPHIVNEKFNFKSLAPKLLAIGIMFIGTLIVFS